MSESWGHAVRPLTDEERAWVFAPTVERPAWWRGEDWDATQRQWLAERRRCSRRCPNDVACVVSYRYITGRAGRVGFADKRVCEEHGQKFAHNHALLASDLKSDALVARGSA